MCMFPGSQLVRPVHPGDGVGTRSIELATLGRFQLSYAIQLHGGSSGYRGSMGCFFVAGRVESTRSSMARIRGLVSSGVITSSNM